MTEDSEETVSRHRDELSGRVRKRTDEMAQTIRTALEQAGCGSVQELKDKIRSDRISPDTARTILGQMALLEQTLNTEDTDWKSVGFQDSLTFSQHAGYHIQNIETLPDGKLVLTRQDPRNTEAITIQPDGTLRSTGSGFMSHIPILTTIVDPQSGDIISETSCLDVPVGVIGTTVLAYERSKDGSGSVSGLMVWDCRNHRLYRAFKEYFPSEKAYPVFIDGEKLYLSRPDDHKKNMILYSYSPSGDREDRVAEYPLKNDQGYENIACGLIPPGNIILDCLDPFEKDRHGREFTVWDPVTQTAIRTVPNTKRQGIHKISDTTAILYYHGDFSIGFWNLATGNIESGMPTGGLNVLDCKTLPDPVSGYIIITQNLKQWTIFDPVTRQKIKSVAFPPADEDVGFDRNGMAVGSGGAVYFGQRNELLKFGPRQTGKGNHRRP